MKFSLSNTGGWFAVVSLDSAAATVAPASGTSHASQVSGLARLWLSWSQIRFDMSSPGMRTFSNAAALAR